MARQNRITLPQATRLGLLTSYEEVEPLLIEAELRGRIWTFKRASRVDKVGHSPSDSDIYALHKVMFDPVYEWAGQPRNDNRGPGGLVHVEWHQVRLELKQRFDNLAARVNEMQSLPSEPTLEQVVKIIAQGHHDFQYVHPFPDTNGRTGRVLDHYFLWVTFGLAGASLQTSPILEYFPTSMEEDTYYESLGKADAGYPEQLNTYFLERVEAAFRALERSTGI